MTNPSNMVRVRARNGGRASVYEANGWAQVYTQGLLEGNGVTQNTVADMNVLVGGSATKPDVLLATNPAGYKVALDLVSQQAIAITAPASNKRISAIVAYTDDLSLPTTEDTVTGSPASCGLIVVNGTAAANPTEPTDNQIRTAITSDGATGSQAAYCVIATILVASGTSAITNDEITVKKAGITSNNIDFPTFKNYSSQLPMKNRSVDVAQLGNMLSGMVTRYGDLVFFVVNGTISSSAGYDQGYFGTLPVGYRPSLETIAPGSMTAGGSNTGCFSLRINTNGGIYGSCPSVSGNTRVQVFGCWLTDNAWPS